jgi:hypothetical protein
VRGAGAPAVTRKFSIQEERVQHQQMESMAARLSLGVSAERATDAVPLHGQVLSHQRRRGYLANNVSVVAEGVGHKDVIESRLNPVEVLGGSFGW